MPSASEAIEPFDRRFVREVRCRLPHQGSWRHPKGKTCNHLLVRDAAIACKCGQQHNLVGLVAQATGGSWKAYLSAQAILAREFWQLRASHVVTSYYQNHGVPRSYQPELPDWIIDRLDLCDHYGFRPGFFFHQELGGSWMLFELDPLADWESWDFSGERYLSMDNVTLAKEILAKKLSLPDAHVVLPQSPVVWSHIRLWRERWSHAESLPDISPMWQTDLHLIGDVQQEAYNYSFLTGDLIRRPISSYQKLRFEFLITA